jgi:molybdenum cofactor cytidylyltransferase
MNIGLILLAAGSSSRMGSPKQLLLFNGKTLLRRAAEVGIDSGCSPVVVVLGHDAARMQSELENLPIIIAVNSDWQTGMGSSIRAGIEHLEKSAVDAAVVMLCDQPHINTSAICRLLEVYREKSGSVVAASYGETLGVPAIFPRRFFLALMQLPAGSGAKQLLMKHPADAIGVPMIEATVDVDTPDDYQKLK